MGSSLNQLMASPWAPSSVCPPVNALESITMAHQFVRFNPSRRRAIARAALLLAALPAQSQGVDLPTTQTITVSGRGSASLAGFGDVPLARSPFSATVLGASQLQDAGIEIGRAHV